MLLFRGKTQCAVVLVVVTFLTFGLFYQGYHSVQHKTLVNNVIHNKHHLSDALLGFRLNDSRRTNTGSQSEVTFVRAILLYYPAGHTFEDQFILETKWLHRSWQEMLKTQAASWRTDVIVVLSKRVPVCDQLQCTASPRLSASEKNTCRCLAGYDPNVPDFDDYNTVNSINVLLWKNVNFEQYDHVLRSDIDTFLTPAFSNWRPKQMVVGGGGYIQGDDLLTAHRLERVAEYLGLNYSNIDNVGSTWYGPTPLLIRAAQLTVESMRYLKKHEFTKLERSPKFGVQGWPEWHYGVLSMYGGHLAVNHLATAFDILKDTDKLDYYTTSTEPIAKHPHLHSWHTDEDFSKFKFFSQKYVNTTLSSLDLSKCKDYCLYMAIDGNKDWKGARVG